MTLTIPVEQDLWVLEHFHSSLLDKLRWTEAQKTFPTLRDSRTLNQLEFYILSSRTLIWMMSEVMKEVRMKNQNYWGLMWVHCRRCLDQWLLFYGLGSLHGWCIFGDCIWRCRWSIRIWQSRLFCRLLLEMFEIEELRFKITIFVDYHLFWHIQLDLFLPSLQVGNPHRTHHLSSSEILFHSSFLFLFFEFQF